MKEVLQGFVLQVLDKEVALKDLRKKFEGSIASRSMITYLLAKGIDLEDKNKGMG